jgi:hypothetical protein
MSTSLSEDQSSRIRKRVRELIVPVCVGTCVSVGVYATLMTLPLHSVMFKGSQVHKSIPEITTDLEQTSTELTAAEGKLNEISSTVGASPSEAAIKVRRLQTDLFEARAELLDAKQVDVPLPESSPLPSAAPSPGCCWDGGVFAPSPGRSGGGRVGGSGGGHVPPSGGGDAANSKLAKTTLLDRRIQQSAAGYYKVSTRLDEIDFVRTPHMDAPTDHRLQPGDDFDVRVYLNQESSRPGEQGSQVFVSGRDLPDVLQFSVWLDGSPQFEIRENAVQRIRILRNEDKSTEAVYRVHVREDSQDLTNARLTASFSYNQRPVGYVTRTWEKTTASSPDESYEFSVKPKEESPDLTVWIRTNESGQYTCTVSTPHLRARADYDDQPRPWPLKQNAEDYVYDQMGDFTKSGSSAKDRLVSLRAAGIAFYEAAPENFKTVLWKLIGKRDVLKTIYIVTDEPAFPWELMIPSPVGDPTAPREPLGVEFTVGRWITTPGLSPPQQVSIATALVMAAPLGDTEADTLAADEVAQIVGIFPGEQVTPATPDNLEEMLTNHPADILHFVCHGKSGVGHGRQKIGLANSTELDSTKVRGMDGFTSFFHQRNRPVVFLNACEIGNLEPALVGVGGFPQIFASLKAGAVIAPLWSVKHKAAREAAREFYDRLKTEPTTSMATVIRDIRRKTYRKGAEQGEESYAAYCFYGDPLCTRERVLLDNRILVDNERVPEQALQSGPRRSLEVLSSPARARPPLPAKAGLPLHRSPHW